MPRSSRGVRAISGTRATASGNSRQAGSTTSPLQPVAAREGRRRRHRRTSKVGPRQGGRATAAPSPGKNTAQLSAPPRLPSEWPTSTAGACHHLFEKGLHLARPEAIVPRAAGPAGRNRRSRIRSSHRRSQPARTNPPWRRQWPAAHSHKRESNSRGGWHLDSQDCPQWAGPSPRPPAPKRMFRPNRCRSLRQAWPRGVVTNRSRSDAGGLSTIAKLRPSASSAAAFFRQAFSVAGSWRAPGAPAGGCGPLRVVLDLMAGLRHSRPGATAQESQAESGCGPMTPDPDRLGLASGHLLAPLGMRAAHPLRVSTTPRPRNCWPIA